MITVSTIKLTCHPVSCALLNQLANCLSPENDNSYQADYNLRLSIPFSLERLTKLEPDVIFIS